MFYFAITLQVLKTFWVIPGLGNTMWFPPIKPKVHTTKHFPGLDQLWKNKIVIVELEGTFRNQLQNLIL